MIKAILLILALLLQPATSPIAADSEFEAKLEQVDTLASKITSLRAAFTQEKHSPILIKPVVTRGEVRVRPNQVFWTTEDPEPTRTKIDREVLQIYYVKQGKIEEYNLGGQMALMASSPLPRLNMLREQFTLSPDGGEGLPRPTDVNVLFVRLKPLAKELAEHVESIRVVLDANHGYLVAMELTDADGEQTLTTFERIEANAKLEDAQFEFGAPRGVKVVRPLDGSR